METSFNEKMHGRLLKIESTDAHNPIVKNKNANYFHSILLLIKLLIPKEIV